MRSPHTETVCRHRLELMRHIYNGGSSDAGGSFDKDEAWSEVMEAGAEAGGVVEGVAEKGGQRWVMTDPVTLNMMPDTMCVDLSLTSQLASSLSRFHFCPCPQHKLHVFIKLCYHQHIFLLLKNHILYGGPGLLKRQKCNIFLSMHLS